MKTVTQRGDVMVYRLSRNKYEPHQGKRERARRLRRLIAHREVRDLAMIEGDLVTELLKCTG